MKFNFDTLENMSELLAKEIDRDLLCLTMPDDDFSNELSKPYSKKQLKELLGDMN